MPVYIILLFVIGGGSIFFLTVFLSTPTFLSVLQEGKIYQQNGLMVLLLGMHMQNR